MRAAHGRPVAQDRHAVADAEQLVEEVAHVQHRRVRRANLTDGSEQHLHLTLVKAGGRLVHDEKPVSIDTARPMATSCWIAVG